MGGEEKESLKSLKLVVFVVMEDEVFSWKRVVLEHKGLAIQGSPDVGDL